MMELKNTPWEKEIAAASPKLLKGALHEVVIDSNGDVIALCGDDWQIAKLVAAAPDFLMLAEAIIKEEEKWRAMSEKYPNDEILVKKWALMVTFASMAKIAMKKLGVESGN